MSTDTSWVGAMPEVYDRCLGPALFAPFAEHLAGVAEHLAGATDHLAGVEGATAVERAQPVRVLELAAGTGIATAALVRTMPTAQITATDLNPAMVSWASQRVVGPTWRQADAQSLDFPDASFDLVLCQFGVMFFPDKPAAFAETERVLAPGGTLLFAVWDVVDASPFPAALVQSLAVVLPEAPPSFVVRVPHGYADPDQISSDLRVGGFPAASIERVVLPGTAPSARTLAEGFCLGTPLRFDLQEHGSLDELTRAVGAQMTATLGEGPVAGDLAAFVVSAGKPAEAS